MQPIIDHIQITVRDLKKAEPFYDKFFAILGFDLALKSKGRVDAHDFDVIEYVHPLLIIGINSPREAFKNDEIHRRKPGAIHHIAFKVNSKKEVDDVYPKIIEAGAEIVNPPKYYAQHGSNYYALFFKDLEGINLSSIIPNAHS